MSGFFLEKGLVVLREGHHLEFQHRSETHLYFEDPATADIVSLTEGQFWNEFERQELRIEYRAISTAETLTLPEADDDRSLPAVPEPYQRRHERALAYVRGTLRRGLTRGQLGLIAEAISEIATEIEDAKPPRPITVSEWMRKYERSKTDIYALLDVRAMSPKRERRDPEHEALIAEFVQDYVAGGARRINQTYAAYVKDVEKHNEERGVSRLKPFVPISARSFYRRTKKVGAYDLAVARLGRQEARRAYRMIKGHMPSDFPLQYVEIDHAQLPLWVVDDRVLLPLGRPWITAVRDRNSGMLLGVYISFRPPSLASAFGAIRESLRPHPRLAQVYPDLEHEWIGFGLADWYVSDRGREFLSHRYRYGIHQLGSDYLYCESRTPWHKPYIERLFLHLHRDLLERAPGEVFKGLRYHKDYHPKADAVIRFTTLHYLIIKWAVDYHPYRQPRNGRAPIEIWTEGTAEVPPRYPANFDALNVVLGLRATGTLGHEGIRYKHLNYADEGLAALYREIGRQQIEFSVNEENLGRIHVNNPITRQWMAVSCTRPDYAEGLSLYQHHSITREIRAKHNSVERFDQLQQFRAHIQESIVEALAMKESAGKLKIARYLKIDSAAVLAGQPKSIADPVSAHLPAAAPTSSTVIFTDVPTYDWGIQ